MSAPSLTAHQKLVAKVNLADAYLDQRNIRMSDKVLDELLKETNITTYYGLYLKKWLAILAVLQGDPDKANEIMSVRDQAKELEEREVVRDCDFYYGCQTIGRIARFYHFLNLRL